MPNLYIIAGPNGAGKTTAAYTLLPDILHITEFVNADEIARGLSPFNVDGVAFEAGRLMLQRIDYLMGKGENFAFETTLATRSYVSLIRRARAVGYVVTLIFVYLASPELAIQRVAKRVSEGGHNIPEETIRRRYDRGLRNLFELYMPICDYFLLVNNSEPKTVAVASGGIGEEIAVFATRDWHQINQSLKRNSTENS